MMRKWVIIVIVFLALMLVIATISVLSFSEQRVTSAISYDYGTAIRPLKGTIVHANQGVYGASSNLVAEWEGRKQVVKWAEDETIEWTVEIPKTGQYELSVGYYPLEGNGQDIEFFISLDGVQLSDRMPFTLNRAWRDATGSVMKLDDNQLRPKQIEESMWLETKVYEPDELSGSTLKLELMKGQQRIRLNNIREAAMLDYIVLTEVENPVSYANYHTATSDRTSTLAPNRKEAFHSIQAEHPYLKSTAGLFPTVDRTSSYTQPYHPVNIRMNTIGGSNWDVAGQWISWKIEAPETGWYKIGMRYHQNKVKGLFVTRSIYIDGVVPFAELENVRFLYDAAWQIKEVGNENEPYQIYLEKGVHEIKMEVTLGDLAAPLRTLQDFIYDLNQFYRKIVMITGVTPDPFRDYDLDKSIPELIGEFQRLSAGLKREADALDQLSGQKNTTSSTMRMLAIQLDSFVQRPDTIPKRLDNYKTSISGLADVMLSMRSQPLELDYLYIASPNAKPPKAEANVWEKIVHEVRIFAGSFMQDYDTMSSEPGERDNLNVWLGLGRDQAYVLNRMIEESFTPETGIQVNLNLVRDALVKAVMAGVGPDINLFTNRGDAMNLAIRGALEPLDQFNEFEQLSSEFMDSAFVPYKYEGHTYAIPDEQLFFMMFYREDVLQDLALEAPQTWNDLMRIAPVLQNNNLQIGLPYESLDAYALLNQGMGLLNLFPTLLMQNDSGVYNEQHAATRFNEASAFKAFNQWTNFYNLYDYPLYKNDFNRFWTGEMPIVIGSYKLYNSLVGVAPEIQGTWKMVPIPGIKQTDGVINRASAANGTAGIILKRSNNKEEAWTFMEWWNRADIQSQFVKELENELGVLGRRTPANLKAFEATSWSRSEQSVLMEQWKQVQEIPELPGGYYTSRNIDNAFRSVVFQWENPREALFKWNKEINDEMIRKRYEFGVGE